MAVIPVHLSKLFRPLEPQVLRPWLVDECSTLDDGAPQYSRGITLALPAPSSDTRAWVQLAVAGLRRIYRPGFEYQQAGVLLDDLRPAGLRQRSLFDDGAGDERAQRLMTILDQVNRRMGRGTLRLLGEGLEQRWKTKACRLTPCYTTRCSEIAVATAA